MRFGIYLYRGNVITAEQLVSALESQQAHLTPIGQLALEARLLSARDVFAILRSQRDAPHDRFGEIAIEMGLLTRDQLQQLLLIQSDRQVPLVDILVRQRALSKDSAETHLHDYRAQLCDSTTRVRTTFVGAISRAPSEGPTSNAATAV